MPSYTMINIESGEETEMNLSLSEREALLAEGKYKQKLSTAKFISGHGDTARKMAGTEWNDMLKGIKKKSGRGNTIET